MKEIPNYIGRYSITEDGRIWSHPKELSGALKGRGFTKGKWLSRVVSSGGYLAVNLGANNMQLIHRLVAVTYLTGDRERNHINHKDGNKKNNHISNLEWCTQAENNLHARRTGLNKGCRKIPVAEYANVLHLHNSGLSQVEIGKHYNVGKSTIGRTLKWAGQNDQADYQQ